MSSGSISLLNETFEVTRVGSIVERARVQARDVLISY